MPVKFQCKCGKWLQAREELVGKQVRCPGCARMLPVPQPAEDEPAKTDWHIDASPLAADAAQRAGIVGRGRASVVRLRARESLLRDLPIQGEVTCRFCHTSIPFQGQAFGRIGLGGTLANVACRACKSRIWVGYASHRDKESTSEIFVYVPSLARDFEIDEGGGELPAPALAIQQPPWLFPAATTPDTVAATLAKAVRHSVAAKEKYEDICVRAAALVTARLSPEQLEHTRTILRKLLAQEKHTYVMTLLAEALACVRDEEAGPLVQAALRRALETEDPTDKSNAPLRELCVLSLLFHDRSGFKAALARGFSRSGEQTRACTLGKPLLLSDVIDLVEDNEYIDSYESVFSEERLFIYPIRAKASEEETERPGFLSRLFGSRKKADK